jgi:hypothetical protein
MILLNAHNLPGKHRDGEGISGKGDGYSRRQLMSAAAC